MITLYGCKEVKNANGELKKHEGFLVLHSFHESTEWLVLQLNYTKQVLMEQTNVDFDVLTIPNIIFDIDSSSCTKTNMRISSCQGTKVIKPMFSYNIAIFIVPLCLLPIAVRLIQAIFGCWRRKK